MEEIFEENILESPMNQPLNASFAIPDDLPAEEMYSSHGEIQSVKEKLPDHIRSAKLNKYLPKRPKITGADEHWKDISSLIVHPNVANVKRSTVYEHIDFYQSTDCVNVFRAVCKLCRALLTITRASGYLQHFKIKKDHGHNVIATLVSLQNEKNHDMHKITGMFSKDMNPMRKLVEWLVDTFVPPNAVMHQSWDHFIVTIDDNLKRLSYAKLYHILEEIEMEQRKDILRMFQNEFKSLGGKFKHFHIELDMWDEEVNKRHYAAILLSWIDLNFSFQFVCLDFKFWEGPASGEKIKGYVQKILKEWELDGLDFDSTSDAGSNMKKALADVAWNHCIAHNINNAIDTALGKREHKDITGEMVSSNPNAAQFLKRIRALVGYFKRSGDRSEKLKGVELEVFSHVWKVIQDHHIRWSSTSDMLERLWQIKPAIQKYFAHYDPDSVVQLTVNDWQIVAQCIGVLGPARQTTQAAQNEAALNSEVYGMIQNLLVAMSSERSILVPTVGQGHGTNRNNPDAFIGVQSCELHDIPLSIRELLEKEFNERFDSRKLLTDSMYLGLFFDPRLKELSFLSPSQKREAIKKAKKEYNIRNPNRFPRPGQLEGESEVCSSDDENATENVQKNINHFADFDFFGQVAQATVNKHIDKTDFGKYIAMPQVVGKSNFSVLGWWKENEQLFPIMSGLARTILGSRPTSANVERAFSHGKHLISPLRAMMLPQHVELWMFTHLNRNFSRMKK